VLFSSSIGLVEFQSTRKDFKGDITVVTFPMLRQVKMSPIVLGEQLGQYLVENSEEVVGFNVVKGFFKPCAFRCLLYRNFPDFKF
jgi:arginyl-tRNA synthetase